jgi:hypothetical protein
MSQYEGPLVTGIELGERRPQELELVRILDPAEVIERDPVVESISGSPRTVTSPPALSTVVIGEFVAGDSEEPRCDSTGAPAEPVEAGESAFERCCRDVFGQLRIPATAVDETMNPVDMPTVDLSERIGIRTRLFDERSLVEQTRVVRVVSHQPPA